MEAPSGPVLALEVDAGGADLPDDGALRTMLAEGDVCERVHAARYVTDAELLTTTLERDASPSVQIAAAASLLRGARLRSMSRQEVPGLDDRLAAELEHLVVVGPEDRGIGLVTAEGPEPPFTPYAWHKAQQAGVGVRLEVPPGLYQLQVRTGTPEGALRLPWRSSWAHIVYPDEVYPELDLRLPDGAEGTTLHVVVEEGTWVSTVALYVDPVPSGAAPTSRPAPGS